MSSAHGVGLWWMALTLGCVVDYSAGRPDIGNDTWVELRSQHFVLTTDLSHKKATKRLRQLEQLHDSMVVAYGLVAPARAAPTTQYRLVILASCSDFKRVAWSEQLGGYVSHAMDFSRKRITVTCEGRSWSAQTLVHEVAHNFNHHYIGRIPAWLEEGLATYYQTVTVKNGKVKMGAFPEGDVGLWRAPIWVPKLNQLTNFSRAQFYKGRRRRHYFSAWKLVHLLNSTDDYHRRFQKYLALLAAGRGFEPSWESAFEGIDMATLHKQHAEYHFKKHVRVWTTPYSPPKAPTSFPSRRLRVGEVHAVWAHLQMIRARHTSKSRKEALRVAGAHLDLAREADPDWNGVIKWRAAMAYATRKKTADGKEASGLLEKYIALEPNDDDARFALFNILLDRAVPDDYIGLTAPPPGLAPLHQRAVALIGFAKTVDQLNQLGWYFALRHQPNTGLNFAMRALKKDPACAGCWDTLALLHYHRGHVAKAIAAQERAVDSLGEGLAPRSMRARLKAYRTAGRAKPPTPTHSK